MAAPTTPRHKRLAIVDERGNRSSSTPPNNRNNPHLLAPAVLSPSSRHSSPGIDRLQYGRHYADDMIPRRLTASPVAVLKSKDKVRKRLARYSTIDHAVELLKNAKNIVVLTGAGISTSLNIPDFRSSEGFYSKLSSSIGLSTPEEFFSIDFFKHNSESFWDNVRPLLPKHARDKDGNYKAISAAGGDLRNTVPRFSKTHAFLSLLLSLGKLLTNYTQNIDNLEHASGVKDDKAIKCHGSWDTATCLTCNKNISARKYLPIVWENGYPRCSCAGQEATKTTQKSKTKAKKRKRAIFEGDSDHSSDDGTAMPKGLFKPDITFFGEKLPEYYVSRFEEDKLKADLVLIVGTSLKVRPVRTMVVDIPPHVPQIWINKDRFSGWKCDMPGVQFDIELLGECDMVVEELCRRAGYPLHEFTWTGDASNATSGASQSNHGDHNVAATGNEAEANGNHDQNAPGGLSFRDRKEPPANTNSGSKSTTEDDRGTAKILFDTSATASKDEEDNKVSKPVSDIRVEADFDAEWRWRFTRRSRLSNASVASTVSRQDG